MKRWYAALRSRNGALAGACAVGALVAVGVAVLFWGEGTSTDTTSAGVDLERLDGRWLTCSVAAGTAAGLLLIWAVRLLVTRYREVPRS